MREVVQLRFEGLAKIKSRGLPRWRAPTRRFEQFFSLAGVARLRSVGDRSPASLGLFLCPKAVPFPGLMRGAGDVEVGRALGREREFDIADSSVDN
jgi:hypothetical protein